MIPSTAGAVMLAVQPAASIRPGTSFRGGFTNMNEQPPISVGPPNTRSATTVVLRPTLAIHSLITSLPVTTQAPRSSFDHGAVGAPPLGWRARDAASPAAF